MACRLIHHPKQTHYGIMMNFEKVISDGPKAVATSSSLKPVQRSKGFFHGFHLLRCSG